LFQLAPAGGATDELVGAGLARAGMPARAAMLEAGLEVGLTTVLGLAITVAEAGVT
jgi:hypothetical protein